MVFTERHQAEYEEPTEFTRFCAELPMPKQRAPRIRLIKNLFR